MLEIAAAVAASGGNDGIKSVESVDHLNLLTDAGAHLGPALDQDRNQTGIVPAGLGVDAVSGDHPANQVVQSDPRNVARHHDAQGLRLTGPGFLLQPAQPRLDRLRFKGVQPHLCSMLNF